MSKDLPSWARTGRKGWRWNGNERPPFAHEPGPGQESVWDYPRPPRLDPDGRHVVVRLAGSVVAETRRAVRVLETASAPTFYIPREDVALELLRPETGVSRCEWKGTARYWSVATDDGTVARRAAWSYDAPFPEFAEVVGHLSFYPALLACTVDGERVQPQPGGFYGGWVTSEIVGPIKGEAGSAGW